MGTNPLSQEKAGIDDVQLLLRRLYRELATPENKTQEEMGEVVCLSGQLVSSTRKKQRERLARCGPGPSW